MAQHIVQLSLGGLMRRYTILSYFPTKRWEIKIPQKFRGPATTHRVCNNHYPIFGIWTVPILCSFVEWIYRPGWVASTRTVSWGHVNKIEKQMHCPAGPASGKLSQQLGQLMMHLRVGRDLATARCKLGFDCIPFLYTRTSSLQQVGPKLDKFQDESKIVASSVDLVEPSASAMWTWCTRLCDLAQSFTLDLVKLYVMAHDTLNRKESILRISSTTHLA